MAPVVVLVGPPGAGKSSVGAVLASRLGVAFRDVDADIETAAGMTIPDIFTTAGEEHFRALERTAVERALAEHDGVLSLGGGAILDQGTRALLAAHRVAYLSVSMPTGVRRTGMAANRPLLVGVNPRATFKTLLDARIPLYRQVCTVEIDTDDKDVDAVAAAVAQQLELGR